jgi:hypothetical protein
MIPTPTFLPHFSGARKSEGCYFQSEWLLYGREPNGVRAEPGKQKAAKLQDAGRRYAGKVPWACLSHVAVKRRLLGPRALASGQ